MQEFVCPLCENGVIMKQNLVFCADCNIFLGQSSFLTSALLLNSKSPPFNYNKPIHTKLDKFWYGVSFLLVIIAAAFVV